jgi:hypothetical protein
MGTIVLTHQQWTSIEQRLRQEYKNTPSVMLLRSSMQRVLGFTVREHKQWVKDPNYKNPEPDDMFAHLIRQEGWYEGKKYEQTIRLDFYDDIKETFFRMKYL